MMISHNQQLGHTWLIIIPYDYHDNNGLYLININSPFPA